MRIVVRASQHSEEQSSKPYLMAGAGRLASSVWKIRDENSGWTYRFNLFKLLKEGRVTQRFRPNDLVEIAKLCRVLATVLVDDGSCCA